MNASNLITALGMPAGRAISYSSILAASYTLCRKHIWLKAHRSYCLCPTSKELCLICSQLGISPFCLFGSVLSTEWVNVRLKVLKRLIWTSSSLWHGPVKHHSIMKLVLLPSPPSIVFTLLLVGSYSLHSNYPEGPTLSHGLLFSLQTWGHYQYE